MIFNSYKKNTIAFTVCFYALILYKFINNDLLCQLPHFYFFLNNDITEWMLLSTRFQELFLNGNTACLTADILFSVMPALLCLTVFAGKQNLTSAFAIMAVVINFLYAAVSTVLVLNSSHSLIIWMITPFYFVFKSPSHRALAAEGVRYFFIWFFTSAGIWKVMNGGVFHTDQLSAILLSQHADLIFNNPDYPFSACILWLSDHDGLTYAMYLLTVLVQLGFSVGFLTKRFDKYLGLIYVVFVVADLIIMQVPYFETLPYLLFLRYNNRIKEIKPSTSVDISLRESMPA